ncbi:MAG: metallophosphoesterase [Candidatus Bathyarchaeota archaeon]|nr:metallophosphoesterase [Candidatus Bathyarchaeota archaeon]
MEKTNADFSLNRKTYFIFMGSIQNEMDIMLVGAISDTHDNLPLIEKAVATLNEHKVDLVLHAGDYVAGFVISKFKALNCKLIGVFGNNDGDHELLKKRFSETTNCTVHERFATVTVNGYRIALLHGEEIELLNVLAESGYFDAIVHGHSHIKSVQLRGKTLVVNPGEVCGYLTGKPTAAILDTTAHEAKLIEL